jgi:hypothetical protein
MPDLMPDNYVNLSGGLKPCRKLCLNVRTVRYILQDCPTVKYERSKEIAGLIGGQVYINNCELTYKSARLHKI